MRIPPGRPSALSALALVLAPLVLLAGCGHRVGDTCNTNVDCSPLGDRFCDISVPNGYCTIEGCDVRLNQDGNLVDSCQGTATESICIRFFTPESKEPCDPLHAADCCAADELCVCDSADTTAVGICNPTPTQTTSCVGPSGKTTEVASGLAGHCAQQSSERRWCMLRCNQDSDCRAGFSCVAAGTNGAEPVPRGLAPIGDGGPLIGTGDYTQKFCLSTSTQ